MGAIALSKNGTLAVIAVALKSRCLENCPAFIVLARTEASYVHRAHLLSHSPLCVRVCWCACVEVCRQRTDKDKDQAEWHPKNEIM